MQQRIEPGLSSEAIHTTLQHFQIRWAEFSALDQDNFFLNCAAISVFLSDSSIILQHMKTLNALLLGYAQRHDLLITDGDNLTLHKTHRKMLRTVLEQEIAKLGFYPKLAKAVSMLSPAFFCQAIANGLLIKDPGAGDFHGEFTHVLQWLAIGWQQLKSPLLHGCVIDFYKKISKAAVIWDTLLDHNSTTKDCRSPLYLNWLITRSDSANLWLLRLLLQERTIKRHTHKNLTLFNQAKYDDSAACHLILTTQSPLGSITVEQATYILSPEHLYYIKDNQTPINEHTMIKVRKGTLNDLWQRLTGAITPVDRQAKKLSTEEQKIIALATGHTHTIKSNLLVSKGMTLA